MAKKKQGIDISKWQTFTSWSGFNGSGLDFVILRSSYRKSVDPKFFEYVNKCKIPIKGCYHFIYAHNTEEAKSEANCCVSAVSKAQLSKDVIIFADYEYDSINDAAKKGVKITPKECNQITEAFCSEVEKSGYKVGIYYNKDFYMNWYDKVLIEQYIKWLADYHDTNPAYPCDFHQYSSTGKVPGIKGNVDMNYYYPSEDLSNIKSIDEIVYEVIAGKWGNGAIRKSKLESAGYNYSKVQQRVNAFLRGQ